MEKNKLVLELNEVEALALRGYLDQQLQKYCPTAKTDTRIENPMVGEVLNRLFRDLTGIDHPFYLAYHGEFVRHSMEKHAKKIAQEDLSKGETCESIAILQQMLHYSQNLTPENEPKTR